MLLCGKGSMWLPFVVMNALLRMDANHFLLLAFWSQSPTQAGQSSNQELTCPMTLPISLWICTKPPEADPRGHSTSSFLPETHLLACFISIALRHYPPALILTLQHPIRWRGCIMPCHPACWQPVWWRGCTMPCHPACWQPVWSCLGFVLGF